jgi:hypothetical protein
MNLRVGPATYTPNLLRGATIALVLALIGNVGLLWFRNRTGFTIGVGIASAVVAVAVTASYGIRPLTRLRDDAYLAAFAVWMASGLELALTSDVATPTRFRSSLVYLALAVLALSSYLRTWTARQYPEAP